MSRSSRASIIDQISLRDATTTVPPLAGHHRDQWDGGRRKRRRRRGVFCKSATHIPCVVSTIASAPTTTKSINPAPVRAGLLLCSTCPRSHRHQERRKRAVMGERRRRQGGFSSGLDQATRTDGRVGWRGLSPRVTKWRVTRASGGGGPGRQTGRQC